MEGFEFLPFLAYAILVVGYLVGVIGSVVPGIPGAFLIVAAAWLHEFLLPETFGAMAHGLLIGLAILAWLADLVSGVWGAKLGGATKSGLWGASLGGFLGFILFAFVGMILGTFFGALIGDIFAKRRDWQVLLKSGGGAVLGVLAALVFRIAIVFFMGIVLVAGVIL